MATRTRLHRITCLLAVFLLAGCGAGGLGEEGRDYDRRLKLSVPGFAPATLDSEIETAFTVSGADFGPVGATAVVRLEAAWGTPFLGGTSGSLSMAAAITSDTLLTGASVPMGVTGTAPARVTVILPSLETATSSTPLVVVSGPTLTDVSPREIRPPVPTIVTVTGSGFGPVGGVVTMRFTAESGTPFLGSVSAILDLPGRVDSATQVTGTTPPAAFSAHTDALASVVFPSGATAPAPAAPVTFVDPTKLYASGGYLGWSLAVSSGRIIALASSSCHPYTADGTDWTLEAVIPVSASWYPTRLRCVAVTADFAFAGDPELGGPSGGYQNGGVYVFERVLDGPERWRWEESTILYPSDAEEEDHFGTAVAVSGSALVVGAPGDDDGGAGAGAAYLYVKLPGGWIQRLKLRASDGAAGDGFGSSVAMSGDTIVVGAPGDDDLGADAGSAYVFEKRIAVWQQADKLLASDGVTGDGFGSSVGATEDTAVIGTGVDAASGTGSAYVFVGVDLAWTQQAELVPTGGRSEDAYGSSVAIDGDTAVVGAPGDDELASDAGAIYRFTRLGTIWTGAKVVPVDGYPEDGFGTCVAMCADTIVVGAPGHDSGGVLYAYER